jgi:hypothetical protein
VKINKLELLEKGWKVSEVEHASRIISEAENKKHIGIKWLDKSIYTALLFLMVVANVACTFLLIPFLFAMKNNFVIVIVTSAGFMFGVIFSILIADIEKTDESQKIKLLITLAACGVVNFGLISTAMYEFSARSGIAIVHNPYLIGGIYLFAFLVPHTIFMLSHKEIGR